MPLADGRAAQPSLRCCGVRIDLLEPAAAADEVVSRAVGLREVDDPCGVALHLCNAWTLACARQDRAYAELLDEGDLNLPDGMPLVWLARQFGVRQADRVYGPDLLLAVLDRGRTADLRHYFYGTTSQTLGLLSDELHRRFPDAVVVGVEAPPFRPVTPDELDGLAERLVASGADVVWIGLGTPQQDAVVRDLRHRVAVVAVPVGAAFDFVAGNKAQAPAWMQRHGMEWLFRLLTEPRRLWRRYLLGNVQFVRGALSDLRRARRGGPADPGVTASALR